MILRLITLMAGACLAGVLSAPAMASGAGMTVCEADVLILRNAVIMDASGRWDDQDILIEQGEISAIGSDLEFDSQDPIAEIDTAGAVVRPRQSDTLQLFVRTSTTPSRHSADADFIMPGMTADFTVFSDEAEDSPVRLELRDGEIAGVGQTCFQG